MLGVKEEQEEREECQIEKKSTQINSRSNLLYNIGAQNIEDNNIQLTRKIQNTDYAHFCL